MKKLLIATDNFLPRWDGIARFLSELIPRIKDEYDITVIAPDFPGEKKDICNVIRIPLFNFRIGDFQPARFKLGLIKKKSKKQTLYFPRA